MDDDFPGTTDQIDIQIENRNRNSSDLVSRDDNIVIVMKEDVNAVKAETDLMLMSRNEQELQDNDNTNIISTGGNYGYGDNLLNVNY